MVSNQNVITRKQSFRTLDDGLLFFAYATAALGAFGPSWLAQRLNTLRESQVRLRAEPENLIRLIRQASNAPYQAPRSPKRRKRSAKNAYTLNVLWSVEKWELHITYCAREITSVVNRPEPCKLVFSYQQKADRTAEPVCEVQISGNERGVNTRFECGLQKRTLA